MIAERPRRPWDRAAEDEREYFDLLGEGLVVQLSGHREGYGRADGWSPASGGAWLHVGPEGTARAFTGKAEVGQGTQVALALLVAEELRLPLERVDVHMADTDLCPWDIGTFGSRSMPDAGPALRTVADAARRTLLGLAEARGLGPRAELEAWDGHVRGPRGARAVSYGDLVRGMREVVTVRSTRSLTPGTQWRRAGRPVVDPRASDVVTGRRRYVSDLELPGMRYGAVLFPPSYGARLRTVDASAVLPGAGVQVVHEGDFAGVVAPTPREARRALAQLRGEWTEPPQPAEEGIEAYLRGHPLEGDSWDTNELSCGNPRAALAKATVTLRATYRTAYIAHAPLETRTAVAQWDGSRVTVWLGSQTPFRAREGVAKGLGIPLEDVRVIVPYTGAGFGGKHGGDVALAAARLARAAKGPVRLSFSREEEFQQGYFRPMAIVDLWAGADREGRLAAWIFHNVNAGAAALLSPYPVPHQKVDNELSDSPLPQGPYRALAANANNFARESAIDELAAQLGVDPLAIREKNLDDARLLTVLHRVAEAAGWASREGRKGPGKGFGLALGREKGGRVATVAEVTVHADERVRVDRLVSAFEAGAIVHPQNLRSQVEGATIMAMGGALFEAIHFERGRVLNPRFSEYRVPRFSDLPRVDVLLVDRPDLPPAGAGETPMIAVAPAIANAIFDATGTRLRSLPVAEDGRIPRPTRGVASPGAAATKTTGRARRSVPSGRRGRRRRAPPLVEKPR